MNIYFIVRYGQKENNWNLHYLPLFTENIEIIPSSIRLFCFYLGLFLMIDCSCRSLYSIIDTIHSNLIRIGHIQRNGDSIYFVNVEFIIKIMNLHSLILKRSYYVISKIKTYDNLSAIF